MVFWSAMYANHGALRAERELRADVRAPTANWRPLGQSHGRVSGIRTCNRNLQLARRIAT